LSEGEGDRRDALIVAANDAGWSALARSLAERAVTPTHSFPPRCVIVAARPPDVDALRRVPGVRVVVDVLPQSELASLPEELRLAAAAWNERLRSRAGQARVKGRGESWDAPGFLPPDPPAAVREHLRRREAEEARRQSSERAEDETDKTDDREKP